jgi:2-phosphosulfolactate phosphatase
MEIDVQLMPCPISPQLCSNRIIVVIDVLRATSAMVQAFSEGAVEIIPVRTVEEAFEKARRYPPGTTLLGGEKDTRPIEGFDLGNSPREYVAERVRGKRLIMRTTNGTQAFGLIPPGTEVVIASFFNMEATARICSERKRDLLLFPSGDEGRFALEDAICGGMLVDLLREKGRTPVTLTDASHCLHVLYEKFKGNLVEAFYLSRHGKELIHVGLEDDLRYCARVSIADVVPFYDKGVIRRALD